MVAIQEQLLAAVGDRRGVGAADRLCEACVVLFGVDAAAIWSSTGANAGTLGASHLRRPPGPLPLPSSPPVIGRDAPPASRNRMGRGGPLQFPPPLSERSEPLTPGSPSRLHLQDLHRFHGLRPSPPGSALPCPTRLRAGLLTTVGSRAGAVTRIDGRSRSAGPTGFPLVPFSSSVVPARSLFRFQLPPVKPCMRFSRTRLTDAVHRRHSASPARACWPWVPRRFRSGSATRTRTTGRLCARLCPTAHEPLPGIGLGRPVQRVLKGTHLVQRNLV